MEKLLSSSRSTKKISGANLYDDSRVQNRRQDSSKHFSAQISTKIDI